MSDDIVNWPVRNVGGAMSNCLWLLDIPPEQLHAWRVEIALGVESKDVLEST